MGKAAVLATLIALSSLTLHADVMFMTGNHHQPGEENILFNTAVTGMTIAAHTNMSHTDVQFSSTTDVLVAKGGQSDIDAMDGLVNNITFTIPGHTFGDFILNPFKPAVIEDLTVTAVTNMGTFHFTYGDIHGNNFLTIVATNGQVIDSVTVNSAGGFLDLKQPRVSEITGVTVVDEPRSLLLWIGGGLVGLTVQLRRRLKT